MFPKDKVMKRPHLFEFEDFRWFPTALRDYMTDFLQFVANRFDIYKPVTPLIEEILDQTGERTIIDLASGGGGGMTKLSERLRKKYPDLQIVLTDIILMLQRLTVLQNVFRDFVISLNRWMQ